MLISGIPAKFQIPFANSAGGGFIRSIPQASQIGITPGAASLTDGFPPATFLPVGSGGTPPFGQDFNGLLNQITLWNQWNAAGGVALYDATYATSIGGYPRGAILASTTTGVVWLNLADSNATNPDSGGTNWTSLYVPHGSQVYGTAGTFTFTVPAGVFFIWVSVWGAGGGSGGTSGTGSASLGGGGGAFGMSLLAVTPGQTITIIVGAAGTAGSGGGSPTAGGTGGTSSVGAFITCTGGQGGIAASGGIAAGVSAGGSASGGNLLNINGETSSGPAALSGSVLTSQGGSAPQGGAGGHLGASPTSANGIPGIAPGGGAGGSAEAAPGAVGAAGQVMIEW